MPIMFSSLPRTFLRSSYLLTTPRASVRQLSAFSKSPVQITVSDDGETIVCWHPERLDHVKYEYTKPLTAPTPEPDSILKADVLHAAKGMFKQDLTEEDLIRLAYTPRQHWKKLVLAHETKKHIRKPKPPLDRIGI